MTLIILGLLLMSMSLILGVASSRRRSTFDDHWRSVRRTLPGTATSFKKGLTW